MPIGAIGKYERLEILGHGTSGIVYLAWDTLLRRNVALKEIRAAGPEMDRLLAEARVLDRLRHPNIIDVHSVDVQDGVILIDMELVAGKNLAEVLRARTGDPFSPAEAVTVVRAVLEALAYAHARRIVHRDIKPANILIGSDGKTVKLTDFGLAEALGSGSVAGGGGTYPYMAPEDFAEDAASDYRADLWAVGVVLYELLTGRRPFTVARAKDPFAWKRAIETEVPLPPSAYTPALSHELDALVLRSLVKEKAGRFQSAEAFLEALAALGLPTKSVTASAAPIPQPAVSSLPAPPVAESEPMPDIWRFGDGTVATTLDELLFGAAKNWDEARLALGNGQFERFLRGIGETYIAELARELASRPNLGPDRRLREFLERAQPEPVSDGDGASGDADRTVPFALPRVRGVRVPRPRHGGGQTQVPKTVPAPPRPTAAAAPPTTQNEPGRFRWWFPFAYLVCLAPGAAGLLGNTRFIPRGPSPVALGLASTGIASAMLLLVVIGVRMPVWTRFFCLFPVALGVMAGGVAAAALIDGNPTPERLLAVSVFALIPLGVLLIQAATSRRLWRLWLALTFLATFGLTALVLALGRF